MLRRTSVLVLTAVILSAPAAANAQEKNFGIAMGFPASVGAFWKVSDRFAVRPEFDFLLTNESNDDESSAYGVGVTGLIYLKTADALRPYVAPRFTYERHSSEDPGNFTDFESRTNVYSLSGLFGVQYLLGDRFLVFGEVGVRGDYASSRNTATNPFATNTTEPTQYSIGSTGGVGIVFFF